MAKVASFLRSHAKFGGPIVVAALAGLVYASWPLIAGSADPDEPAGRVPVEGQDSVIAALVAAEERVGFSPLVPSILPTSANTLVWVDASAGPPGSSNSLRLVELVYRAKETSLIAGEAGFATLEMFQTNGRLNNANGELVASDIAGFEVFRDVVSVDAAGEPTKVTYTARAAGHTFVMDFTGDQPTVDGLRRMLESLAPFKD